MDSPCALTLAIIQKLMMNSPMCPLTLAIMTVDLLLPLMGLFLLQNNTFKLTNGKK
jgi:hypothetical protein